LRSSTSAAGSTDPQQRQVPDRDDRLSARRDRQRVLAEARLCRPYITSDFASLRNDMGQNDPNRQKVMELNGDLDLFGDGSIYIHRAVSHIPGREMVVVRLPKTGPIVLTSDACYLMDNLQKDILPSVALAYDPSGMMDAYSYIKHLMSAED
jgi:hypothetical protein